MVRFPHIMTWTPVSESTQDPENGWTIPGVEGEPISVQARYAPVQSKQIRNQDNVTVLQKGKVFLPINGECPAIGTQVVVSPNMFSGEVLDVYKAQLGWEVVV